MRLFDENGRIIKSPEVIEHLLAQVRSDAAISDLVGILESDIQPWGSTSIQFSSRLIATGAPVLLKVNVPNDQLWWTRKLADERPALLPTVFATGERVGDEPLGWILWERVRGCLNAGWHGREFDMTLEAGVRFSPAAGGLAPEAEACGILRELTVDELAKTLEHGLRRAAPGPAGKLLSRLADHWSWVAQACETAVCHGDLHLANALCREAPPAGEALLVDCHPIRMPWAIEAARLEILNADPDRRGCRRLVEREAAIRSRQGMSAPAGTDLARLEAIVLGWCALQSWGYIGPSLDTAWRARKTWHAENEAYITGAALA